MLDARDVVATLDEALAGCALTIGLSARPREFAGRVLPAREAAREALARASEGDVALVFGTEMSGLSQRRARALRDRGDDSRQRALRVAQSRRRGAGHGVRAAHRLAGRAPCGARRGSRPRRTTRSKALYAHAQRTLAAMRFSIRAMPKRLLPRLRRLFARAGLEREEVNILRGILARIDEILARNPKN